MDTATRLARKGERGFSLVEMLIAAFLAVIISAMMFAVLSNQETAARRTNTDAQMQEGLRFALQVMARQIRMTGYGVGYQLYGSTSLHGHPSLFDGAYTFQICDGCGKYETGTGSDQLMVVFRNPATEFDLAHALYRIDPPNCTVSALTSAAGPRNQQTLTRDTILTCMDDGSRYQRGAYLWTVRNDSQTGSDDYTQQYGGSVRIRQNSGEFLNECTGTLPVFMRCGSLEGSAIGFYLSDGDLWMDDNGDSLSEVNQEWCHLVQRDGAANTDDIPLATGIEDMQFALCIPGYDDDAVGEDEKAQQLAECMGDSNSTYWHQPEDLTPDRVPQIRAIRITLVAVGRDDLTGRRAVSARPVIENHTDIPGAADPRPRMVQSTIVQLPNIRYRYGLDKMGEH